MAVRLHEWGVKTYLLLLAACALLCLGYTAVYWAILRPSAPKNLLPEWSDFRARSRDMFQIPVEANPVEAWQYSDFPMGGGEKAVFRLPNTKSPETWLKVISQGTPLENHQSPNLRYEANGELTDLHELSYDPATRLYTARWHWD